MRQVTIWIVTHCLSRGCTTILYPNATSACSVNAPPLVATMPVLVESGDLGGFQDHLAVHNDQVSL